MKSCRNLRYFNLVLLTALFLWGSARLPAQQTPDEAEVRTRLREAASLQAQGRYQEAYEAMLDAYQAVSTLDDPDLRRDALRGLARGAAAAGQPEQALRYQEELVQLNEGADERSALAQSLLELGRHYQQARRHGEAAAALTRALGIFRVLADEDGLAQTRLTLGINAFRLGQYEEATGDLEAALPALSPSGAASALAHRYLGEAALLGGRAEAALDHLNQAVDGLESAGLTQELRATYELQSQAHASLEQPRQALDALRAAVELPQAPQAPAVAGGMDTGAGVPGTSQDLGRLEALTRTLQQQLEREQSQARLLALAFLLAAASSAYLGRQWQHSKRTAADLRDREIIDPLTGLLNRRAILARLQEEWHRSSRFGRPFACALIDIDELQTINDAMGETGGDHVIRTLAEMIQGDLRGTDALGRFSGGQLLLVAPEVVASQAAVAGERLRGLVANATISGMPLRQITISAGLTDCREARSAEQMIQQSEQALQQAKSEGRNRISIHPSATGNPGQDDGSQPDSR